MLLLLLLQLLSIQLSVEKHDELGAEVIGEFVVGDGKYDPEAAVQAGGGPGSLKLRLRTSFKLSRGRPAADETAGSQHTRVDIGVEAEDDLLPTCDDELIVPAEIVQGKTFFFIFKRGNGVERLPPNSLHE